jgi:hypothetical protein
MIPMRPIVSVFLASMVCGGLAHGQACGTATSKFWKNDILPQIPSGATAVSIIPGLCEGEAAGSVFTIPGGTGAQMLEKVAVGFGANGGINGFQAVVNVEIYDGIVWSGNTPILGAKVFDFEQDYSASFTVTSHGINELDLTPYNVVVGNGTNAFVVVFRSTFNFNGNCASGFTANFFTDNPSFSFNCNTVAKKNVIFIQGQGWRDPKFATVSGLPLCPIYYNGNWVIRACTQDVAPAVCQQNLGLGGPGNTLLSICGGDLSTGTTATFKLENANASVPGILLVSPFFAPTFSPVVFGVICPIPATLVLTLPTDALGQIVIPGVPGGGGPFSLHMQMITPDPAQIKGYEVSNCLKAQFLP